MKTVNLLLLLSIITAFSEELVLAGSCDSTWSNDELKAVNKSQYTYKDGKSE